MPLSSYKRVESDPHGRDPHSPGAKLDDGKIKLDMVLREFASALWHIGMVGTFGELKYTENGWLEVPNGIARYADAAGRHKLKRNGGEMLDPQTALFHEAHELWNHLASFELKLRELDMPQRMPDKLPVLPEPIA